MKRLVIENLSFHAAGPIDLSIEKSECVGITGPSGSGKTLFLRAVADLDPHEGKIFLDGIESEKMPGPQWRKKVGMLQSESSWWFEIVGEHFYNIDERHFTALGLEPEILKWKISRLSSGERQRLALLRLLCRHPDALLLDEPTANLDSENIDRAETFITDFRLNYEISIIWVSHDIN